MRCLGFIVSSLLDRGVTRLLPGDIHTGFDIVFLRDFVRNILISGWNGSESSRITANFVPLQHSELFVRFARVHSNMGVPSCSGKDSAIRTVPETLLARVLGLRDLDGFQFCLPDSLV